jgi:hypothetical protein
VKVDAIDDELVVSYENPPEAEPAAA